MRIDYKALDKVIDAVEDLAPDVALETINKAKEMVEEARKRYKSALGG